MGGSLYTRTEKASEVVQALPTEKISKYSVPHFTQSNKSPAFVSKVVQQDRKALRIHQTTYSLEISTDR